MAKHVLIFLGSFNIGGTTTSLSSLLSVIDPNKIQFDVFAFNHTGVFEKQLTNCTILKTNPWLSRSSAGMSRICKARYAFVKLLEKFFIRKRDAFEKICIVIGAIELNTRKYDAIVSFQENITGRVSKIPAKRRISWIHSDYSRFLSMVQERTGVKDERSAYEKIDRIVCVSEYAKNNFAEIYPEFISKIVAIHNIINVEEIHRKAQEPIDDSTFSAEKFTIVSCGRLDPVKQFHLIPRIAAEIKKQGSDFNWYIIGGGDDVEKKRIESEIEAYNVKEQVYLLGSKNNPYPYLAKADLYVCTSVSESYSMVVNEAKALRVPVISNSFPSVFESIEEGADGYVVGMEEIGNKILEIINKPIVIEQCRIDNRNIENQVYELF